MDSKSKKKNMTGVSAHRKKKSDTRAGRQVGARGKNLMAHLPKLIIFIPLIYLAFKAFDFMFFYQNVEVVDVFKGKPAAIIDIEGSREVQRVAIIVEDDTQETHISFVAYVVLNSESGEGFLVYIPGWVYLKPQSEGIESTYKVADLLYLSELIHPDNPYELAITELESNLAMEIDEYIWFKPDAFKYLQDIGGDGIVLEGDSGNVTSLFNTFSRINIFFNASSAEELFSNSYSSYSFVNIWSEINKFNTLIDGGAITMIEVNKEWGTTEDALSIGKTISLLNHSEVDSRVVSFRDVLRTRDVQKEQVKIEVYNGSEVSGLASRYTRRFENSGIDVVRTDNAVQIYDKSVLYVTNPEKFNDSLEVVKGIVAEATGIEIEEVRVIEERPEFLTTGDIVVVLGSDIK